MKGKSQLLAASTLLWGLSVANAGPPESVEAAQAIRLSQRVVYAAVCAETSPGATTCKTLYVYQVKDVSTGEYLYTMINPQEFLSVPGGGYSYRQSYCKVVDERIPRVLATSASVPLTALDMNSPSCESYSSGSGLSAYSGIVTVEGDWLNPDYSQASIGVGKMSVNSTGVRLNTHCRTTFADGVLAGGFSIDGEYLSFGPSTPEYTSQGYFTAENCASISP
jgi:hypothetical protein